ncbi:MAG: hypothetical protein NTY33_01490 [Candidatus Moranbacteria bacterium]|nr:hypothetical protein [Candidatus Moranbacteria bacterium]
MADDDGIGELIALGLIVLIGAGIYAVLCAFGSHECGDEVTKEELTRANSEVSDDDNNDEKSLCQEAEERGEDVCWKCLTVEPQRCGGCGGCIKCNGDDDGSGTCCSWCG